MLSFETEDSNFVNILFILKKNRVCRFDTPIFSCGISHCISAMVISRKDLYKEIRILYKYVIYEGLNSGLLLKDENENANK